MQRKETLPNVTATGIYKYLLFAFLKAKIGFWFEERMKRNRDEGSNLQYS